MRFFKKLLGGNKKMKEMIELQHTSFQSITVNVTINDEIEISGVGGDGVAFSQTLSIPGAGIICFDPLNRNFSFVSSMQEITPQLQVYKVIRGLV